MNAPKSSDTIIISTPRQASAILAGLLPPQAVVLAAHMASEAQHKGERLTLTITH